MRPPRNDAELFDHLARLFGFGSYDDVAADEPPFWRYRMIEIAKVKRARTKANVTVQEAADIAEYCKATGVVITSASGIYRHYYDARRWQRKQREAQRHATLDQRVSQAIEIESAVPDSPWIDRLIRASGPYREEVLLAWEKSRSSPTSSESQIATSVDTHS